MQFLYPQFLWALLLLLIPVLVHLFQLRRFRTTFFTNVALLQKLTAESNKSKSIKKWLLLLSRLLAIAALVFAFARPLEPSKQSENQSTKPLFVYLDNSLSMQANVQGVPLLETAIQELVSGLADDQIVEVMTNDRQYGPDQWKNLKTKLPGLRWTTKKRSLDEVALRARSRNSNSVDQYGRALLLSDFQEGLPELFEEKSDSLELITVALRPEDKKNAWVDSLAVRPSSDNTLLLDIWIAGGKQGELLSLSVEAEGQLLAKTSLPAPGGDQLIQTEITLSTTSSIAGFVQIQDNSLSFDNRFYFSIQQEEQIRVLAVGEAHGNHLERVYQEPEFLFVRQDLNRLDFGLIPKQNLLILDQLYQIPDALRGALTEFHEAGGSLCIIPAKSIDLNSYTQLLSSVSSFRMEEVRRDTLKIDGIQDKHPLFSGVFRSQISDFETPESRVFYPLKPQVNAALLFENESPFVLSARRVSVLASPLDSDLGSFEESPLIVPTFYNMGKQSIRLPDLYARMGNQPIIDLPYLLGQDQVFSLRGEVAEYIPQQQAYPNRTELVLSDELEQAGLYQISTSRDTLGVLAINYPVSESRQNWNEGQVEEQKLTLPSVLKDWTVEGQRKEFWKWAVALALLFLFLEMGIQKWIT